MRTKTMLAAVCCLCMTFSTAALAGSLSFQTEPILGTNYSSITGDVVMITGPTPTQPGGGFYYDVDGNLVLGPTIPHYSDPNDPLYQVGSPSMTLFWINPNVWDGVSHWYDPNVWVYSGSGVNLDASQSYHYTGVYSYRGSLQPWYDVLAAEDTAFTGTDFIMLNTGIGGFWREDVGPWRYTETWTDNTTAESVSAYKDFQVAAVPEPATLTLLFSGLGALGVRLRRRKP